MGYDRGDRFPFDFEPNEIPFGSKSKGNLSPRSYPIHCERNWKYSFLSVLPDKVMLLGIMAALKPRGTHVSVMFEGLKRAPSFFFPRSLIK